ncbi:MAG: hypothetical protein J6E43_04080 [Prevotella sp.]|nr:hypothetical protein [Prevotella sp.]
MKVKTTKILCGVLAMLAFTACSSNIDDADGNRPQVWHVTLQASMGDEITRALSEGTGNAIIASFAENDEVVVVDADGSTIVGTLKAQSAGASTTLTGTLDAKSLIEGEVVTLRYRSATANYDSQAGTLAGIAASQDYEEGTLTVKTTSPELTFTSNHVTLRAKQSITKFTFKDASTNAIISVKTFGIAAAGLVQSIAADATSTETIGAVTGTLASASSEVYVALRNNVSGKQQYFFTIKDDADNWYKGTKWAPLVNGRNYTATVTLTKLETLTKSSAVGDIGVVSGLPAIAISGNKAVALMNAGALCPEHYGTYYTFDKRALGLSNDWYVPTQDELVSFKDTYTSSSWGAPNGVNGRTFTIGSNTLFLPAAGYYDNDTANDSDPNRMLFDVSTHGYYWSQTPYSDGMAYKLLFYNSNIQIYSEYTVNELTVRPFHALN